MSEEPRWPSCNDSIEAFGEAFVCTLPKHHDRDGQVEHQDDGGVRWWATGRWVIADA